MIDKMTLVNKRACDIVDLKQAIALLFIALLTLSSCGQKRKREISKAAPATVKHGRKSIPHDRISLFNIDLIAAENSDTVGFVSVSDIDTLSRKINSLVIPDLKNKKVEDTQYFILESKYRKRLLTSTGISETDSLFAYDYSNDVLLRFSISSLSVAAFLSPYEDATEGPHSEGDYMLGFKIDRTLLSGLSDHYFTKTLVYIGATNPFARGKMHPVIWEKTDPKTIPPVAMQPEDAGLLKGFKLSGSYTFQANKSHFYLQEFSKGEELPSERLLISNAGNKVVFNELYQETESSSPASLSFANDNKNEFEQWTGYLFKNKPPVILGFEDVSFGCPVIPFLGLSRDYIVLNCDNRH